MSDRRLKYKVLKKDLKKVRDLPIDEIAELTGLSAEEVKSLD